MASFNWIDYSILGILVFSALISFARGFVREAISLLSWILAIWVAYKYGHDFGQNVLTMITSDQARSWVGAAVLFFGILIAGSLLNFAIGQVVSFTGLSAIDRILGMAFGFARGVLLIAILMLIGEIMHVDQEPWWIQSQLIPQFSVLSEWLKGFVPEQFEKLKQKEALPQSPANSITVPSTPALEGTVVPQALEIAKQHTDSIVTQVLPVPAQPQSFAPVTSAPPTSGATTTTISQPAVEQNSSVSALTSITH